MFSNQYMGTRPNSRNLSRAASTTVYGQSGPYSRLNAVSFFKNNIGLKFFLSELNNITFHSRILFQHKKALKQIIFK